MFPGRKIPAAHRFHGVDGTAPRLPEEFGLVGMVTAVTGVLALFKDAGLSMVTVQRVTITDEQISTLFWINMVVGVFLAGLSMMIAPVLVSFFREPRLFWVTVAMGSGFVFNAAATQHQALLQRRMRYFTLAVIEIISLLASIAVGVAMALGGYSYWALVGMAVILPATNAVCVWIASAWVPGRPAQKCRDPFHASFRRLGHLERPHRLCGL